jgi:Cu/Ag efflux pump CusA
LLVAVFALWVSGQSVNLMNLGGLDLSVGILVDEATVAIENIHTRLAARAAPARASADAALIRQDMIGKDEMSMGGG